MPSSCSEVSDEKTRQAEGTSKDLVLKVTAFTSGLKAILEPFLPASWKALVTLLLGAAGTERSPGRASAGLPDGVDGPQGGWDGLGALTERGHGCGEKEDAEAQLRTGRWVPRSRRQMERQWLLAQGNRDGVTRPSALAAVQVEGLRPPHGSPSLGVYRAPPSLWDMWLSWPVLQAVSRAGFSGAGSRSTGWDSGLGGAARHVGGGCLPRDGLPFRDLGRVLRGLPGPGLLVGLCRQALSTVASSTLCVFTAIFTICRLGVLCRYQLPCFQDLVPPDNIYTRYWPDRPPTIDGGGPNLPGGVCVLPFKRPGLHFRVPQKDWLPASKAFFYWYFLDRMRENEDERCLPASTS